MSERLNFFINFFKERPNLTEFEISQEEFGKLADELRSQERFLNPSPWSPVYSIKLKIENNRVVTIFPICGLEYETEPLPQSTMVDRVIEAYQK